MLMIRDKNHYTFPFLLLLLLYPRSKKRFGFNSQVFRAFKGPFLLTIWVLTSRLIGCTNYRGVSMRDCPVMIGDLSGRFPTFLPCKS